MEPRRAAVALCAAALAAAVGIRTVHGQQQAWSAPYCGPQPRISQVFDHDSPNYQENGSIVLYTGTNKAACADANGNRYAVQLEGDGHSGWDYTRSTGIQGCGTKTRPGLAMDLVFAVEPGRVYRSRWDEPAHDGAAAHYGLYVDIDHGASGPVRSLYGHLAAVFVEEGDFVFGGQLIGALGSTGNSTGPHLHFHGAKGNDATVSRDTFDPFGWCRDWSSWHCPYPGYSDPHRGNGWSERMMAPGLVSQSCPGSCGEPIIVDDSSSTVQFGCRSGVDCPGWKVSGQGWQGSHHWVYPNGSLKDYWVQYRCPQCSTGTYLVSAYVPYGSSIANTHIARYEIEGRVTIVDQHEEGARWQPLGVYTFYGTPVVELSDRTDRYDYTARAPQKIGADAIQFVKICSNIPRGIPH